MVRPLRRQFEGALYHLVVRGTARQRLFRDDQDRRRYIQLLHRYQNQFGLRIYAYALMTCRVQLLLETPKGSLSKAMQCLGTSYAAYFNRRYNRRGSLYEGRYRSYLLLNGEQFLLEATRYIHRAAHGSRLNRNWNHRWSSYRRYLECRDSGLIDTRRVLSLFGENLEVQQRRYREFTEGSGTGKSYRGMVRSQVFPGLSGGDGNKNKSSSLQRAHEILRTVRISLSDNVPSTKTGRKRALVHHVAMYLIRKQTQLSLNVIGGLLGVKAPAVALAIGRLEKSLTVGELPGAVCKLLQTDSLSCSRVQEP